MSLNPAELGASIPIVAIVTFGALRAFRQWAQHQLEIARIKAASPASLSASQGAVVDDLRREIARLRDTTTKYDISVEQSMAELRRRLEFLESGQVSPVSSTEQSPSRPEAPEQQPAAQSAPPAPVQPAEQTLRLGG